MVESLAEKVARGRAKLIADGVIPAPTDTPEPEVPQQEVSAEWNVGLEDIPSEKWQDTPVGKSLIEITSKKNFTCEMAYKMYTNLSWPAGTKSKEVSVLCPNPGHKEKKPSCSINIQENVWDCFACHTDGDPLAIAALNLGYDFLTYKQFLPAIREDVAKRLGYYRAQKTIGNPNPAWIIPRPTEASPIPHLTNGNGKSNGHAVVSITTAPSHTTSVDDLQPDTNLDTDKITPIPDADWSKIAAPGTFIDLYMRHARDLQVPEAYNFWNAMIGIGGALGRSTHIPDAPPVYGNLYICTVGATGSGKSKAYRPLLEVLNNVLPYVWDDPGNFGVRIVESPASGEALIYAFQREIPDPNSTGKTIKTIAWPVKALLLFQEMDEMYAKMQRVGGTMAPNIIKMYDNNHIVSTISKTDGHQEAVDPFCCAIGTIQLKMVPKLLSEKDSVSGFSNRWIFVMGPEAPQELFGPYLGDIAPVEDALRGIYAWSQVNHKVHVPKGSPGYNALVKLWKEKLEPVKKADDSGLLVRIDLLLKKLCLLLAANVHETELSVETVDRVEILFDYILETYKIIGAKVGQTELQEREDRILRAVKNFEKNHNGECPTATQICRVLKAMKISMKELRSVLEDLSRLEVIEIIPGGFGANGKRGRTGSRYRFVAN